MVGAFQLQGWARGSGFMLVCRRWRQTFREMPKGHQSGGDFRSGSGCPQDSIGLGLDSWTKGLGKRQGRSSYLRASQPAPGSGLSGYPGNGVDKEEGRFGGVGSAVCLVCGERAVFWVSRATAVTTSKEHGSQFRKSLLSCVDSPLPPRAAANSIHS